MTRFVRGRAARAARTALAALVAVAATAAIAPATAEPEATRWKVTRGTVAPGAIAGSYLLASDGAPGRYSVGELISVDEVALPYRFTVTWRRLGVEAGRSMHVLVAGGVVLIKAGAINFWAYDDAAFASAAWQPLAGHAAQNEHTVVVDQDAGAVVVTIDGAPAARFPLTVARARAHVGVGMKAAPGARSKIYLRSLIVAAGQ